MKKELKGKCTNCGKPMEQESTEQWKVYCPAPECFKELLKANKKNLGK